jgi:hypothetical protein
MTDRYTRILLTVIALLLAGFLWRPLLETRTVSAQAAACGTAQAPCYVNIVGGPPSGAWQGAPILAFDAQAESRAQAQATQTCGTATAPCYATIIGGPGSLESWQGVPLIVIDSQRIVPRRNP